MLSPEKKTVMRSAKKKASVYDVPKFRETPMTQPEPRYYKEVFRTDKNIAQMHSVNTFAHVAPDPVSHPRADAKQTARMMKSNF